jgi:hypothetical protein
VALKYHQTNKQTVIVYVLNSGIENDTLDQAKYNDTLDQAK